MQLRQALERHQAVIPWIMAGLCLLECLAFLLYHHADTGLWAFHMPDTNSYIHDGYTLRPPLYPLFLKACGISPEMPQPTMIAVSLVPMLLYVLSVAAFTRMSIGVGGMWGGCLSLIYALFPSINILPLELGTESLSMSFMVIIMYLFWQMLHNPSRWLWMGFSLMILIMLFIKPAFLFVPVGVAVVGMAMWVLSRDSSQRQLSFRLLVSAAVAMTYILVYSAGVYYKWGVFTPSTVSLRNDYYEARLAGALDPSCSPDADLAAAIETYITSRQVIEDIDAPTWIESIDLTNDYDNAALKTTINKSRKSHADAWHRYFKNKVSIGLSEPLIYAGTDRGRFAVYDFRDAIGRFLVDIGVTWWIPIVVAAIFIVVLLYMFGRYLGCRLRKRDIEADGMGMWCFTAFLTLLFSGNILVVVFGAPYDFSRLLLPSLPVFFLLVASLPSFTKRLTAINLC